MSSLTPGHAHAADRSGCAAGGLASGLASGLAIGVAAGVASHGAVHPRVAGATAPTSPAGADHLAGVSSGAAADYTVRPFGAADWASARAMLLAGYPDTPAALWDTGFQRLQAVPPAGPGAADAPLGVMLRRGQAVVGVALMLPSRRAQAPDQGWHVNASSWAILPEYRSRALWMARTSMAAPDTVYSALTPIPSAARMLQRLGFEAVSHQNVVGFTPRLCRAAGAHTRVLAAEPALAALRQHPLAQALRDHHRLGCLVCALDTPDGLVPLVWRARRRLRCLRVAELLYTPSQVQVAAHVGALARHLLARGYLVLEFEAQQDLVPDFPSTRLFQRRFARGPYAADGVDRLYSELVYLHR